MLVREMLKLECEKMLSFLVFLLLLEKNFGGTSCMWGRGGACVCVHQISHSNSTHKISVRKS